jgi:hypothetical protein
MRRLKQVIFAATAAATIACVPVAPAAAAIHGGHFHPWLLGHGVLGAVLGLATLPLAIVSSVVDSNESQGGEGARGYAPGPVPYAAPQPFYAPPVAAYYPRAPVYYAAPQVSYPPRSYYAPRPYYAPRSNYYAPRANYYGRYGGGHGGYGGYGSYGGHGSYRPGGYAYPHR